MDAAEAAEVEAEEGHVGRRRAAARARICASRCRAAVASSRDLASESLILGLADEAAGRGKARLRGRAPWLLIAAVEGG